MHIERDKVMINPSVCPSVCRSHYDFVSKRMHISSKFRTQPPLQNSTGIPSAVALNTMGAEKNCDFRHKSPFISENGTISAHGHYKSLIGSHRQPIDPCRFRLPWETLKGGTRWVKIFWKISTITAKWFDR